MEIVAFFDRSSLAVAHAHSEEEGLKYERPSFKRIPKLTTGHGTESKEVAVICSYIDMIWSGKTFNATT